MKRAPAPARTYARIRRIDGRHPYQRRVPRASVPYRARRRPDAEVAWFNFELAREMGLIPADHPARLDPALRRALLDAFGLVIVNEYDLAHGGPLPERALLPHPYMATRYLQLQHPDRRGGTSGDGRSVWNGTCTHRGVTWDVSSCGTGVTRLCPATARTGRFFKTGSHTASYGCGTAALSEALCAVLLSEVFHRNGIATERVLAVLELPGGQAICVRAARNLLRPSHFFVHLKRGDLESLRASVDCFVERQIANGDWPALPPGSRRYRFLAEETARRFARMAATFEREYVFCWLEWDGDNILADGGIIDYGSVRQFGLYHREYRFDDVERFSTTIPEQRRKARYIVQTFAQIRDFLCSGRKSPLASFARDPVLTLFDAEFAAEKARRLLDRIGFEPDVRELLLQRAAEPLERFRRAHDYFERARSARGPERVPDGLTWNAIFSTRDLLRELPERYRAGATALSPAAFLAIASSTYATRRDRALTPHRARMAREFQRSYRALLDEAARLTGQSPRALLARIARRAAVVNRFDRITGDGVEYAVRRLLRRRRGLSSEALHELIARFVELQDRVPRPAADGGPVRTPEAVRRVLDALIETVAELRHGL